MNDDEHIAAQKEKIANRSNGGFYTGVRAKRKKQDEQVLAKMINSLKRINK